MRGLLLFQFIHCYGIEKYLQKEYKLCIVRRNHFRQKDSIIADKYYGLRNIQCKKFSVFEFLSLSPFVSLPLPSLFPRHSYQFFSASSFCQKLYRLLIYSANNANDKIKVYDGKRVENFVLRDEMPDAHQELAKAVILMFHMPIFEIRIKNAALDKNWYFWNFKRRL